MNKIRVTVVIEVDKDSSEKDPNKNIENFIDSEIERCLLEVRYNFAYSDPKDKGELRSGTTWKYTTENII